MEIIILLILGIVVLVGVLVSKNSNSPQYERGAPTNDLVNRLGITKEELYSTVENERQRFFEKLVSNTNKQLTILLTEKEVAQLEQMQMHHTFLEINNLLFIDNFGYGAGKAVGGQEIGRSIPELNERVYLPFLQEIHDSKIQFFEEYGHKGDVMLFYRRTFDQTCESAYACGEKHVAHWKSKKINQ